jgi:hypothetical protein
MLDNISTSNEMDFLEGFYAATLQSLEENKNDVSGHLILAWATAILNTACLFVFPSSASPSRRTSSWPRCGWTAASTCAWARWVAVAFGAWLARPQVMADLQPSRFFL